MWFIYIYDHAVYGKVPLNFVVPSLPVSEVKEIGKRVSAHLNGADMAGAVVRTVTGQRISTSSAERDGLRSVSLTPLDAFRSPMSSMMASPWPDEELSYAYEEDETWKFNLR